MSCSDIFHRVPTFSQIRRGSDRHGLDEVLLSLSLEVVRRIIFLTNDIKELTTISSTLPPLHLSLSSTSSPLFFSLLPSFPPSLQPPPPHPPVPLFSLRLSLPSTFTPPSSSPLYLFPLRLLPQDPSSDTLKHIQHF